MSNRFALIFLCIELDWNEICEVMLLHILLLCSGLGPTLSQQKGSNASCSNNTDDHHRVHDVKTRISRPSL